MHQTTIRFGAELWGLLEKEAERTGVSVAQYVRDAALARAAYAAGQQSRELHGDPFGWADLTLARTAHAPSQERGMADEISTAHASASPMAARATKLRQAASARSRNRSRSTEQAAAAAQAGKTAPLGETGSS